MNVLRRLSFGGTLLVVSALTSSCDGASVEGPGSP